MFGFDKIKKLAKDNINRVVKSEFKFQRKDSDQSDEDYEEILINENQKLKELVKQLMHQKEADANKIKAKDKEYSKAKDDIEDLRLKVLELASQKQILHMKHNF